MPPEHSRQRRHARLTLQEPMSGGVQASHDVQILDLSLGGARLEHTVVLRPGSTCFLRLPFEPRSLTVVGSVAWSQVVERVAESPGGTTVLLYQSGLEFGSLGTEARARLTAFLEQMGTPHDETGGSAPRAR
ncbi:MAG: PilZ domain-containing protein [Candidatus Methylomirabilales bacterium]